MATIKHLRSAIDLSQNWLVPYGKSLLECRRVQRPESPEKFIAYLSSHNGCTMGCRFCFLTAQGQTSFLHADLDAYERQLALVLGSTPKHNATRLNVNLMARGEPLANKVLDLFKLNR